MEEPTPDNSKCLCEIEICQVCGANPCNETNQHIRKRNTDDLESVTKPMCNCTKCIKCPLSVVKRLCQLTLKNEERQSISMARNSLFEGGQSLDFDKKLEVDERGDFLYKRSSKIIDYSSDELKSQRGRISSKEKSSDSGSETKRQQKERPHFRHTVHEDDALILAEDEGIKSKRKSTKKDLSSSETLSIDVSSLHDETSTKNNQNSSLEKEVVRNAGFVKLFDEHSETDQTQKDVLHQNKTREKVLKSDMNFRQSAKIVKEVREGKNIEWKDISTISKTRNYGSRLQAGKTTNFSKMIRTGNKHNDINATEKSVRKETVHVINKFLGNFKSENDYDLAGGSKERTNHSNVTKNVRAKKVQDILVYHQQEDGKLRKTGKQSIMPNTLQDSTSENNRKSLQGPNGTINELRGKHKQSVNEQIAVLETHSHVPVKQSERYLQNANKLKVQNSVNGKKAEMLEKTRKFGPPGYRSSMDGFGRGRKTSKYNLGLTRFDQIVVSDLMRMRLEADDQKRIHPVCDKPEVDVTQRSRTMNASDTYAVKPTVQDIQVNGAFLPPPINPLGYCYM